MCEAGSLCSVTWNGEEYIVKAKSHKELKKLSQSRLSSSFVRRRDDVAAAESGRPTPPEVRLATRELAKLDCRYFTPELLGTLEHTCAVDCREDVGLLSVRNLATPGSRVECSAHIILFEAPWTMSPPALFTRPLVQDDAQAPFYSTTSAAPSP